MTNKEAYQGFVASCDVPIYSQSWWMDAVCGPDNWDVWLYRSGNEILAAMPYYMEQRGAYRYITKAPLTQNNGIIFRHDPHAKLQKKPPLRKRSLMPQPHGWSCNTWMCMSSSTAIPSPTGSLSSGTSLSASCVTPM